MRYLMLASAAILIASSAPSDAREHTQLASFRPCRSIANGQTGWCRTDPRLAYGWSGAWQFGEPTIYDQYGEPHNYDFWHDEPHGWNWWH